MTTSTWTFGERLREARAAQKKPIREVAEAVGISPSYYHDLENDRRVPTPWVIEAVCELLGLDAHVIEITGKLTPQQWDYYRRKPLGCVLIQKIAENDLSESGLKKIIEQLEGPS